MTTVVEPRAESDGRGESHWITLTLDLTERVLLVLLYTWLAVRMFRVDSANQSASAALVLCSEGIIVFFVLTRRPATAMSMRPGEWFLALAATTAPLCVRPGSEWMLLLIGVGVGVGCAGIALQIYAKLTLGRSFGCVPALRGLKTAGPYRYVRHPIYAGYLLTHVGFLAMNFSTWNLAIYLCCYLAQIPRLHAEERLLGQDREYAAYRVAVPSRLIPGIY